MAEGSRCRRLWSPERIPYALEPELRLPLRKATQRPAIATPDPDGGY